jgi:hypothetical protein
MNRLPGTQLPGSRSGVRFPGNTKSPKGGRLRMKPLPPRPAGSTVDRYGRPLSGAALQSALAYREKHGLPPEGPTPPGGFVARKGHYKDKRRRPKHLRQRHGLTALRQVVEQLGGRLLDGRGPVAQALAQWRSDLIADLGGPDQVSTQQIQIVELCCRSKLLLDSIDTWLLSQGKLVYGRTKTIYPAVIQRQHLADGLAKHLQMLGLERRGPKPLELSEYLAQKYPAAGTNGTNPEPVEEGT